MIGTNLSIPTQVGEKYYFFYNNIISVLITQLPGVLASPCGQMGLGALVGAAISAYFPLCDQVGLVQATPNFLKQAFWSGGARSYPQPWL